jgi:hypothetical protein
MATFPALKPTSRSFKPGDFPSKTYRALSGAIVKRSFGNRATGYELALEFANISSSVLDQILDHYLGQKGTLTSFALPASLVSGYSTAVGNAIRIPSGIEWFYAAAPDVQSVIKGLSTVRIRFIGELA